MKGIVFTQMALIGCDIDVHQSLIAVSIHKSSEEVEMRNLEACSIKIDLLQTIPGVGKDSAISIVSEVGINTSGFPDETYISS